jgi:hypothetical protein
MALTIGSAERRGSCGRLGAMNRKHWHIVAWSLFGIALLVLACWPLMIWRHVKNGMPLSPAVFETLLWPLAALAFWLAVRGIWAFLSEG